MTTLTPFFVSPKYPDQVYDATGDLVANFYGDDAPRLAQLFADSIALAVAALPLAGVKRNLQAAIDTINAGIDSAVQYLPTDGPTKAPWQLTSE
jgi:hypothetical protein